MSKTRAPPPPPPWRRQILSFVFFALFLVSSGPHSISDKMRSKDREPRPLFATEKTLRSSENNTSTHRRTAAPSIPRLPSTPRLPSISPTASRSNLIASIASAGDERSDSATAPRAAPAASSGSGAAAAEAAEAASSSNSAARPLPRRSRRHASYFSSGNPSSQAFVAAARAAAAGSALGTESAVDPSRDAVTYLNRPRNDSRRPQRPHPDTSPVDANNNNNNVLGSMRSDATMATSPFSCFGQADGFYPDPSFCTQYYICTFGRKSVQNCPVGTVYNPGSYVCDFPEKVVCGTRYLPPSYIRGTTIASPFSTTDCVNTTLSPPTILTNVGTTYRPWVTPVAAATDASNAIFSTPNVVTKQPVKNGGSVLDCDFDNRGQCEYMQDVYDDFDWIRNCGPTPSETTGPDNDHTRGHFVEDVPHAVCSGHYMFVEASLPRRQGDLARFISPTSYASSKTCLQFWYHMRGLAVGALRVYSKTPHQKSLSSPVWSRSSSQSNEWIFGQVTLNPGPLLVVFEAEIGKGWSGDIAIDDIRALPGECGRTRCVELLYPSQFCDRVLDCEDRGDELDCGWCPTDFFLCPDFTCVVPDKICDGRNDCSDGSDEKNCIQLVGAPEAAGMERLKTHREHDGFLTINIGGRWRRVCSDNWPLVLSDEICHYLGYRTTVFSKMEEWRSTDVLRLDTEYLLMVAGGLANAVRLFRQSLNCTSGNVLYLNCGEEECGRRPAYTPVPSRIIGGTQSAPGVWPWHVQILVNGKYQCGGSLVGRQWVATASHCVEAGGDGQFTIIAGSVHRIQFSVHQQERIVDMKLKHPKYKHYEEGYDIALLRVKKKFDFNDFTRPICLPLPEEKLTFGERCVAVGWGTTDANEGPPVETLRHVFLPVVSNSLCNSLPWLRGRISGTMVCAGSLEGGRDTCGGDSGGSLACQRKDGRWFLAGITSWGYGCGAQNNLGVYARVPSLVKWARNAIQQHKLPHELEPGYGFTEKPTTNNNFYHRNLYALYHR